MTDEIDEYVKPKRIPSVKQLEALEYGRELTRQKNINITLQKNKTEQERKLKNEAKILAKGLELKRKEREREEENDRYFGFNTDVYEPPIPTILKNPFSRTTQPSNDKYIYV